MVVSVFETRYIRVFIVLLEKSLGPRFLEMLRDVIG